MTEPVFAICERAAEVQPLLDDHLASRKHTDAAVVAKGAGDLAGIASRRCSIGYFRRPHRRTTRATKLGRIGQSGGCCSVLTLVA